VVLPSERCQADRFIDGDVLFVRSSQKAEPDPSGHAAMFRGNDQRVRNHADETRDRRSAGLNSRFQPLDQGIIQSFKAHYRRQWLSYMLECYNTNHNPMDTMNLHLAIRWTLRSWNHSVSNTTIYNCFRKSTLLTTPITLPTPINPTGLSELYEQVVRAGNIQDVMSISNFLNPEEEVVEIVEDTINEEQVLQEVLEDHLGIQTTQDDDEDDAIAQPVHTLQVAQKALRVLIEYTESYESPGTEYLRTLERMEAAFSTLQLNSRVQSTLDRWIT
jgi:hypothetical protein